MNDWVTISGIIHVQINGMPWHQAPEEYGPYMTLYNRWKRWCDKGIFVRILQELGLGSRKTDTLLLDSTCIKAHRVACSMTLRPGEHGRKIGRTSGGLNCKLHLVTDAAGRPILMSLTAGQVSDYKGARALSGALPKAKALVADRGYDANWFRNLLKKKKIDSCIPSRRNRKEQVPYDKELYKSRNLVERCFGRLKDWRRVATRYDRCPNVFLNACALAAIVKYWL